MNEIFGFIIMKPDAFQLLGDPGRWGAENQIMRNKAKDRIPALARTGLWSEKTKGEFDKKFPPVFFFSDDPKFLEPGADLIPAQRINLP
jgi:hypothetical protein